MTIRLRSTPHKSQREVYKDTNRFKVLAAGRRWGKSRLGVFMALQTGLTGGRAWWVAPSYKLGAVGWRPLRKYGAQIPGASIKYGERLISLPGGGSVQVRSADDPDSLRGEGLEFAILDEAAFLHERAWTEAIRPALSDRNGSCLFISTPKGKNWFYRLHRRGINGDKDWASFVFPTSDNPHIPIEEIEAAKRDLPERVYLQEYEAKFMDDGGGVFRKIEASISDDDIPDSGQFIIGCDWGRTHDATVFCCLHLESGIVCELDRMTQTDYQSQVNRLHTLWQRYPGSEIIAETNAMGGPIVEALQNQGLPVTGFITTNQSKQKLIDGLALGFERGEVHIPRDPILINELQSYESKRLPSGRISYSAPDGQHDDTVIALALAWSARESAEPIVLMHI